MEMNKFSTEFCIEQNRVWEAFFEMQKEVSGEASGQFNELAVKILESDQSSGMTGSFGCVNFDAASTSKIQK